MRLNVTKTINEWRFKINARYDIRLGDIRSVMRNVDSVAELAIDMFVLGYAQGHKAYKSEQKKKSRISN